MRYFPILRASYIIEKYLFEKNIHFTTQANWLCPSTPQFAGFVIMPVTFLFQLANEANKPLRVHTSKNNSAIMDYVQMTEECSS